MKKVRDYFSLLERENTIITFGWHLQLMCCTYFVLFKNKLNSRNRFCCDNGDSHNLPCLLSAFIPSKLVYFGTRLSISSPATYTTFVWCWTIKFPFITWLIVACTYTRRQHNVSSQKSLSLDIFNIYELIYTWRKIMILYRKAKCTKKKVVLDLNSFHSC